ncbi:MAG: hypothetical protein M0033_02315, partial [Nitrospiraceae bacterium]|nr:hypothetical protein [Nitrospiraceae bacterium]
YLVSTELLKYYDQFAIDKLPYYCHWNRNLSFRVDENYTGNIPLGLIQIDAGLKIETDLKA